MTIRIEKKEGIKFPYPIDKQIELTLEETFFKESGCYDLAYGISICYRIDLQNERAILDLKWECAVLAEITLDARNLSASISSQLGFATVNLTVSYNIEKCQLLLNGEVCISKSCKHYSNVILYQCNA